MESSVKIFEHIPVWLKSFNSDEHWIYAFTVVNCWCNSVLEWLHRADVDSVADVSEAHADPIVRVKHVTSISVHVSYVTR
jgi:hypothetical protein